MIHVDSFSGAAADLKPKDRTADGVLAALRKSPRVSTFDMSECRWLPPIIDMLVKSGKIVEDKAEPYPWLRFKVVA